MNFIKTVRNNWKKCTFAAGAVGYGLYSLQNHLEITKEMRTVCDEVLSMTESGVIPKRIVVILNPVANSKKAEKLFKKYCEPVLHLSGCYVNIIKTSQVGHAKSIVEDMDVLPDVLVIAGGDGTSSEVVTGLMRRKDQPCNLVLLPLGKKNETAWEYAENVPSTNLNYLKKLSKSLIPMLQQKLSYKNVMKYDVIENQDENSTEDAPKPIFGLNRFSWGVLRDIESVKDKYWYFGSMRHHMAALASSFSNKFKWDLDADVEYTPPCPGCKNCVLQLAQPKSYLGKLLTTKNNVRTNESYLVENKNCTMKENCHLKANQIDILCKNNAESFPELQTECISALQSGIMFIKDILNVTNNRVEPSLILKSRTIHLNPTFQITDNLFYSIDGEEYDVRPVKITLLPNAIKLFC